jgi:glycosyltransferase involved in cell wall biosynthesis
LRQQVEKHRLCRWVQFLGRQKDILEFMGTCHAGVIASVGSEAVSRVCLEWMSRGRPVAATAVGCLPEWVREGETGFLVPPQNPETMAERLVQLIQNPILRQNMGRRAHAAAQAQFSLPVFAERMEAVYQQALKRRGAL